MRVTIWITIISLGSLVSPMNSFNPKKMQNNLITETEEEAVLKWKLMETNVRDGIEKVIKQFLPNILRSSGDVDISPECLSDLLKIITGVRQLKIWALRLVDSTGKIPSGLLRGSLAAIGNYDECLDVEFPLNQNERDDGEEQTRGQYCQIELAVPIPPKPKINYLFRTSFTNASFESEVLNRLKKYTFALYCYGMRLGVCMPSTCTNTDLNNILGSALKKSTLKASVYSCEVKGPIPFTPLQILAIVAFSIILVLALTGSVLEYCLGEVSIIDPNGIIWRKLISAFSMRRNLIQTFKVQKQTGNILECMNGIRIISLLWIVLGHSFTCLEPLLARSLLNMNDMRKDFLYQVVMNPFMGVQSFYVIAGVLISFNMVKAYDMLGGVVFNVPLLMFKRIWRLLPSELLAIGFCLLMPHLGSGPFYKDTMQFIADNCETNWWYNVLFINNFLDPRKTCLNHAWYIASDLQLFMVAILYFFIFIKKPAFAKHFLIFLTLGSVTATACVRYFYELVPTTVMQSSDVEYVVKYYTILYAHMYPQLSSFAIALGLGTFMARTEKLKLSKLVVVLGWLISVTVGLALVYGAYPWSNDVQPSTFESVLYGSVQNPMWALCLCWVVLACGYGYSGSIGQGLSWGGFQPLVKVSYLWFLLHLLVVFYYYSSAKGSLDYTYINHTWIFVANAGISLMAAIIIRVLFEGPMVELDRVFFSYVFQRQVKSNPKLMDKVQIAIQNNSDLNSRFDFGSNGSDAGSVEHSKL